MPLDAVPRILIIDDELAICKNCVKILSNQPCECAYALSGYEALKMMKDREFDVVVTDLKMSMLGGMEVLLRVKEKYPDTVVVVMTGYASISSAVEVMKMGAFDYLPKPFTPQEFRAIVVQAIDQKALRVQNRELMHRKRILKSFSHQLIGDSPKIKQVVSMVQKVAPTDATVLVYGESGTGKELVARAVYANSTRKDRPFFAVDCGTLSSSLLESELFGHVKGAFTGAHRDKDGIFKLAHSGTLFLDEISNINPEVQSKLLRFLETREFLPLGDTKTQKVDIRLIFATNRDLENLVADGSFREDFYYRIFVYPILIPPLRERRMDILPIAYHFLKQFCTNMEKDIIGFDNDAAERLTAHDWPGNARQLRNVIERAAIGCEKNRITVNDLPLLSGAEDNSLPAEEIPSTNEELKQLKKKIRQRSVAQIEKKFILTALAKNNWNVTQAARKVGLQRTNFQGLMRKHGITQPGSFETE
jgi:DNA-binding NtrC family response regulator